MKLWCAKSVLLAVTTSMLVASFATIVNATPALVVWPDRCRLFDGAGTQVESTDFKVVITWSETGIAHISCMGKGLANPTGKAVQYDSCNNPTGVCIPCTLTYQGVEYSTYNVHETISASGNANLKCRFEDVPEE